MPVAINNPEDAVNAALTQIGYKKRVSNMQDGSDAANLALNIYAQAVDDQLRMFPWGFAQRNATLTLLKTAPVSGYVPPTGWTNAYPPQPWIYEYALPDDYLKVRSLRAGYGIIPEFDPRPVNFTIYNDNAAPPAVKTLCTNLGSAVLVYTAQVHTPANWEPGFTQSLIDVLAKRFAAGLADIRQQQLETGNAAVETKTAEERIG